MCSKGGGEASHSSRTYEKNRYVREQCNSMLQYRIACEFLLHYPMDGVKHTVTDGVSECRRGPYEIEHILTEHNRDHDLALRD